MEINYNASNMKAMADEYNTSLEKKEIDFYLKRINSAAAGGVYHLYIRDALTTTQISQFEGLGFTVCKLIEGKEPFYRICW